MKKKIAIISGALAVVLALGIGMYQSDASSADPKLNYDEVKNIISSQYPGMITELELEKDDNRLYYEVEVENDQMEYELKVDANSGEILKLEEKQIATNKSVKNDDELEKTVVEQKENKKQQKKEEPSDKNTIIDVSEAVDIALAEFPGRVEEVALDEEDGRLIYEVEIESGNKEAEFEIDAMTGEIIVIEIDD